MLNLHRLPRRIQRLLFILPLILPLALGSSPAVRAADVEEETATSIEKGIEFLLKEIEAKQVEPGDYAGFKMGTIALETYALIVAGVGADHPAIQKNFETLAKLGLDQTYSVACYLFALDAAISQLQMDAAMASPAGKFRDDPAIGSQYRPRLEAGVSALVRMRQKAGGWNYTAGGGRYDNSNTQFAVLGLGVGLKRKVPIPPEVWREIVAHFLKGQKKDGPEVAERLEFYPEDEKGEGKNDRIVIIDKTPKEGEKPAKKAKDAATKGGPTKGVKAPKTEGEKIAFFARGWDYDGKQTETYNMTCGGLSSLILAEQALRGGLAPDAARELAKAIRDGYAWVMRNWNPRGGGGWLYYGIYSLEKVADLGEVKRFGIIPDKKDSGHDWFGEVREIILSEQRADGSWPGANKHQSRINSAFALLVLNRATALLTQGRQGKTRQTFAGPRKEDGSDDRNWVYLREWERELHIPTLLRQALLRPSPRILAILKDAIRAYPPESAGFLVYRLVETRDAAPAARKLKPLEGILQEDLVKITGVEYESSAKYVAWYRRFVDVDAIGKSQKDPGGVLLKFHQKTTRSVPLKKKILWAIGRCRAGASAEWLMSAAECLIGDLSSEDGEVRAAAHDTLSLMANQISPDPIPEFGAKAAAAERDAQVAGIIRWYGKGKEGLVAKAAAEKAAAEKAAAEKAAAEKAAAEKAAAEKAAAEKAAEKPAEKTAEGK